MFKEQLREWLDGYAKSGKPWEEWEKSHPLKLGMDNAESILELLNIIDEEKGYYQVWLNGQDGARLWRETHDRMYQVRGKLGKMETVLEMLKARAELGGEQDGV